MNKEDNHTNQTSEKKTSKRKLRLPLMQILNGEILQKEFFLRNLPFLFYIACLLAIYIANVYYAENKIREISVVEEQIKELQTEYISIKADLTEHSKEHLLDTLLRPRGIGVSILPPKVIALTKEEAAKIY
ncbi:MAG: hypothetical protein LC101_10410 [Flavobacteriales bacterium]|nr:hypothetical protein [Flavobacteriales bacterium]MCZ2444172.1 hypothetical protein [Flavobacteriales bacterium]